jgi:crotonobetainyl-CoA:carnitine CoA-transferase CaiB-like acyl-CoA transferase
MTAQPFANVRVLDFTHFLAGPFCTFQLAMQGADILKIEPRGGEAARGSAARTAWSDHRMSPSWIADNAGKRSLTLDLAKPEAVEIVQRLVRDADVVVENFRPGVMDRLGIGYEALSRLNPDLVYCAISGFGATGPESRTPSFDGKIQAMSGLMSLTGDPESGPMRAGFAAADVTAGLTSAYAIASALYQRTHIGRGQYIDVAMLDSLMNMFAGLIAEYTITGVLHRQFGNRSVSRLPTADRFRCGDSHIVLAVLTEKQFASLMTVLGRADVLSDARFSDWSTRLEHAQALREIIEAAMADGGPEVWEPRLTAASVPCATIYTLEEIVAHPQVAHRGTLQEVRSPLGPVRLVGAGFRLAEGQGGVASHVAGPGEDGPSVLAGLGYDAAAIDDLRLREVI